MVFQWISPLNYKFDENTNMDNENLEKNDYL
jgi:hypothetical protein